ncbi:ferredoxin reductase [Streptomyces sp. RK62]|uniref:ferredoxin reductase n=1 Tax=Streptomyces sp. RK62 TaxID=2824893 RepID=UPI001B3888B2|nr:ferredoxin reductase [Streptomyces sp. RK62]MBQ0997119.1 ferredoxin reductase [Streptomyces sp. RK62]
MPIPWRSARLVKREDQTASARTLVLEAPGWPGHLAGQHVDVRLTADDGYQATRSYSLAAPADGDRLELGVQSTAGGEVSPYLVHDLPIGSAVEVRGPLGHWFVWRAEQSEPVLLVAGGSGVVPLMAMIRARRQAASGGPFQLVYSVRGEPDLWYRDELRAGGPDLDVRVLYTRQAPPGSTRAAGRLTAADLEPAVGRLTPAGTVYVCGPTAFVETAADLLTSSGQDPARIRTERFG